MARTRGEAAAKDKAASRPDWQQRALDRSIGDVHAKAIARSARFLETAVELMNETGGFNFSVQDLVDRAGLSLRSFYQHFDGKDDLLLALYEEQMAHFVERVEADLEGVEGPVDRIETLIRSFLERVRRSPEVGGRALTEFQVRLAVEKPEAYARASAPLFRLVSSVVEEGQRTGEFRSDIGTMGTALLINSTLVSVAQMAIFHIPASGEPLTDDHIIGWCRAAISTDDASGPARPPVKRARSRR